MCDGDGKSRMRKKLVEKREKQSNGMVELKRLGSEYEIKEW